MSLKYYDDKCLKLWRECVHKLWRDRCAYHSVAGGRCETIPDRPDLECCHLIGRANKRFRHDPLNAILLCPGRHDWLDSNAQEAWEWLGETWPVTYAWYEENKNKSLASPLWEVHLKIRAEELNAILSNL